MVQGQAVVRRHLLHSNQNARRMTEKTCYTVEECVDGLDVIENVQVQVSGDSI